MIEAKLMRMQGHAMHDAAVYVPPEVKEYWKRRDPILRMEKYLIERGWLTAEEAKKIQADVDTLMEEERAFAEASPMPDPADAGTDVYFDNETGIPLKYGEVRVQNANASAKLAESSATTHYK
jgi:TPP-dependent pyruvate/acetoin dehydrogenase alpha subunit